ncbi:MAG: hypothetical protein GX022_01485 [Clostridiaceae bacterium]|nr:hypothetical protein [Clostridiaceae bacterium]
MKKAMFERDILFPTRNPVEPGSVNVTVYPPENTGALPIVVKAKTTHNLSDYVSEIVDILQLEIFDRIKLDIKSKGIIYFLPYDENEPAVRVKFTENGDYSIEEVAKADILK